MNVRDKLDLLPLRQVVRATGDALPAFARPALMEWLSRPDRYRIVGHGSGGQILAASEWALADAQLVLRQAYGPLVTFGSPAVHTYVDPREECLMVPVIFLRIDAPRVHARELQQVLAEHGAVLQEVDLQRAGVVLRAEIALSRALGLPRRIGELTDGAAHILSWLIRYERALPALTAL